MTVAAVAPIRPDEPSHMPWGQFRQSVRWAQGEHVTLIGPTGVGKTTLIETLIPLRTYVLFLATKRRDDALDRIEKSGNFQRLPYPQDWTPRVIVYPPFPADADKMQAAHRDAFRTAMMHAYKAGNWCVIADEVRYLAQTLKLAGQLQVLWLQGRSLGISLVAATQRPRHVPLEAYDQATHLFLWRDNDQGNIQRLGEIGGAVNLGAIRRTVPRLAPHDFLYINTRTGETVISNARR